ncbi:MAG: hypothetical protein Q9227_004314 [Pyrenula ochraceoflavens]
MRGSMASLPRKCDHFSGEGSFESPFVISSDSESEAATVQSHFKRKRNKSSDEAYRKRMKGLSFVQKRFSSARFKSRKASNGARVGRYKTGLLDLRHVPRQCLAATQHNLDYSRFHRLPGEIRNMIYQLVLGDQYIFIRYQPYRPLRLWENGRFHRKLLKGGWRFECFPDDKPICRLTDRERVRESSRLSLLAPICRLSYQETNLYLFAANIFGFGNKWEMHKFLKERLLVQRQVFERLHLDWFIEDTSVLNDLKGLETVFVTSGKRIEEYPWAEKELYPDFESLQQSWFDVGILAVPILTKEKEKEEAGLPVQQREESNDPLPSSSESDSGSSSGTSDSLDELSDLLDEDFDPFNDDVDPCVNYHRLGNDYDPYRDHYGLDDDYDPWDEICDPSMDF